MNISYIKLIFLKIKISEDSLKILILSMTNNDCESTNECSLFEKITNNF